MFPFCFKMPSLRTLPPSCYLDRDGGVRYILKATADIAFLRNPAVRHQLTSDESGPRQADVTDSAACARGNHAAADCLLFW